MNPVEISQLAEFDAAFGIIGAKVGPRVGPDKRTQDSKEWFVLRHFMAHALHAGIFRLPMSLEKANPPKPDFVVKYGETDGVALIEITEATNPADQKEMTEFEKSNETIMHLGDFGGRFSGGASQPKFAWASDILGAVIRKQGKSIYSPLMGERHLIIYPNSNASALLFDEEDERDAFEFLESAVGEQRKSYTQLVNGCMVHILGKEHVCFDLLGTIQLIRRAYNCPN